MTDFQNKTTGLIGETGSDIQEIDQSGSVSVNLNVAHGVNEQVEMEYRGSTRRGYNPTTQV